MCLKGEKVQNYLKQSYLNLSDGTSYTHFNKNTSLAHSKLSGLISIKSVYLHTYTFYTLFVFQRISTLKILMLKSGL